MDISIDDRWGSFVDAAVQAGRFRSASELAEAGLRLVQEQEAKLLALRTLVQEAIDEGGDLTPDEVDLHLDAVAADLKQAGY